MLYGAKLNPKGEWEHDGDGTMVKQTGKAMPVQFAEYVSKQIAAFIKKEEFTSSGQRVIPPNEYVDAAKKWYCQEVGYTKQKEACGECWLAKHCSIRVEKYGMPATRTMGQVATAPARSTRTRGTTYHKSHRQKHRTQIRMGRKCKDKVQMNLGPVRVGPMPKRKSPTETRLQNWDANLLPVLGEPLTPSP